MFCWVCDDFCMHTERAYSSEEIINKRGSISDIRNDTTQHHEPSMGRRRGCIRIRPRDGRWGRSRASASRCCEGRRRARGGIERRRANAVTTRAKAVTMRVEIIIRMTRTRRARRRAGTTRTRTRSSAARVGSGRRRRRRRRLDRPVREAGGDRRVERRRAARADEAEEKAREDASSEARWRSSRAWGG